MKKVQVKKTNRKRQEIFRDHHYENSGNHRNLLSVPPSGCLNVSDLTTDASTSQEIPVRELHSPERTLSSIESLFSLENGIRGGLEYFRAEFIGPLGAGKLTIVALAIAKSMNPLVVSEKDAVLHLMLARQFRRSTRLERVYHVDIFSRVNDKYQSEKDKLQEVLERKIELLSEQVLALGGVPLDEASPSYAVRPTQRPRTVLTLALPTSLNDSRKYLDGPKSVLARTPCPIVYALDDGYAYVKVRSVVSFLLAMGLPTPFNTPSMKRDGPRSCYNKPAFKQLLSQLEIPEGDNILALGEWTDGVDTGGATKNNRGSLKVTTITIECIPRGVHHTFPVAIGRDAADHCRYRGMLYTELRELSKNHEYYDGILKTPVQHRLLHYTTLCDRPELSDCTGIGHHNGTCSSLPGVASPIVVSPPNPGRKMHVEVKRYLGSCNTCYKRRLDRLHQPSISCKSRSNCPKCCDWNAEQTEYKILAPDFMFPEEEMIDQEGWLKGRKVSFKAIRDAAKKAYKNIQDGTWRKKGASSFLKSSVHMNEKTINEVFQAARMDGAGSFDETCLPAKTRSSSTIEMNGVIPGIMHLLFLGVTKTILALIIELLKKSGKFSPFYRAAKDMLRDIRSLSLQFCKVWSFGSSDTPTGPWVSENCLGFARVMKSIYSLLGVMLIHDPPKVKMSRRVIWSYLAAVSRIMQDEYTPALVNETECMLKLFLSEFETLDASIRADSKTMKPKVETVGNLVYLLRLPEIMRQYGPLREFWEGSIRGEGIFRFLKPLVRRGVHNPGVPQALLSKFYSDMSLSWILNTTPEDMEDMDDTIDPNKNFLQMAKRYTDVHTYQGIDKLQSRLQAMKSLSLVCCNDALFAKVKINSGMTKFVEVSAMTNATSGDSPSTFKMEVTLETNIAFMDVDEPLMFEPCAAVPVYGASIDDCGYYIFKADWKELHHDMQWKLPGRYIG